MSWLVREAPMCWSGRMFGQTMTQARSAGRVPASRRPRPHARRLGCAAEDQTPNLGDNSSLNEAYVLAALAVVVRRQLIPSNRHPLSPCALSAAGGERSAV